MNIKISKEAYEKLIKEDLYFLNEHCPDSLELDHIKVIIFSSIDWYYPDKNTCTALKRIENRLKVELQKQKDAVKQFLSDQEIDGLIDSCSVSLNSVHQQFTSCFIVQLSRDSVCSIAKPVTESVTTPQEEEQDNLDPPTTSTTPSVLIVFIAHKSGNHIGV